MSQAIGVDNHVTSACQIQLACPRQLSRVGIPQLHRRRLTAKSVLLQKEGGQLFGAIVGWSVECLPRLKYLEEIHTNPRAILHTGCVTCTACLHSTCRQEPLSNETCGTKTNTSKCRLFPKGSVNFVIKLSF